MKQTIIIHGTPEPGESLDRALLIKPWFRWLQKEVSDVVIGQFPTAINPIYSEWVSVLENLKVDSETVVIGHSCGGGFLLRYLSEHREIKPAKVILVAPWIDPDGELTTDFMKFEIDATLSQRTDLHMFISSDDEPAMQKTFQTIQEKIPNIKIHTFTDRGHFCDQDFPEILELVQ